MSVSKTSQNHWTKEDFKKEVYAAVRSVPTGYVTTYGDVAAAIGSPRHARHVGFALASLCETEAPTVPWHRVINSKGQISLRNDLDRGLIQQARLVEEGIPFSKNNRIPLSQYRWHYPDWLSRR